MGRRAWSLRRRTLRSFHSLRDRRLRSVCWFMTMNRCRVDKRAPSDWPSLFAYCGPFVALTFPAKRETLGHGTTMSRSSWGNRCRETRGLTGVETWCAAHRKGHIIRRASAVHVSGPLFCPPPPPTGGTPPPAAPGHPWPARQSVLLTRRHFMLTCVRFSGCACLTSLPRSAAPERVPHTGNWPFGRLWCARSVVDLPERLRGRGARVV